MINALRNFSAMSDERFHRNKFSSADFIVTVGKSAACKADGIIRVRPQTLAEAEFGIHIHRRDRKPQSEVGAKKIRLVMIVKRVTGERHVSLKRLVVTELNQVTRDRINLC